MTFRGRWWVWVVMATSAGVAALRRDWLTAIVSIAAVLAIIDLVLHQHVRSRHRQPDTPKRRRDDV